MKVRFLVASLLVPVFLIPSGRHLRKDYAPYLPPPGSAAESPLAAARLQTSDLKPLADALIRRRTEDTFSAAEAYARRHHGQFAGGMAWLITGYGYLLDEQPREAIVALKRAETASEHLGDFVAYFLARAYAKTSEPRQAATLLEDFESRYPRSPLMREATRLQGQSLLDSGQPGKAVQVLARYRGSGKADLELLLGRAYARSGIPIKAAAAFRRVYYGLPYTPEARRAEKELERLWRHTKLPAPTLAQHTLRAHRLSQRRLYSSAAKEYRLVIRKAPRSQAPDLRLQLGIVLSRAGKDRQARTVLGSIQFADTREAKRLYYVLEATRPNEKAVEALLQRLCKSAPRSGWCEEGLLATANMYLLKSDYSQAVEFYRRLYRQFPKGKHADYGHWKAAWLTYRIRQTGEAKQLFEEHIQMYPTGSEVTGALYWRARIAESEGDRDTALAYYHKLVERFRNNYYALLAGERLEHLETKGKLQPAALLEKIPPASQPRLPRLEDPPPNNIRAGRAQLLENGALYDLAARELEPELPRSGSNWATVLMMRFYRQAGDYDRAMRLLKRSVSGYFSLEADQLPRDFWETLFPQAYWTSLKKHSLENGLDPFLVASLIRQESEFNPGAISSARAIGLMQLLPSTGRITARQMKMRGFRTALLTDPETNLRLGTFHLRLLLDNLDGTLEYALAAYNAGEHRVRAWRQDGPYRDMPEFVESIPFTQTREYVKAIRRNMAVYQALYGTP